MKKIKYTDARIICAYCGKKWLRTAWKGCCPSCGCIFGIKTIDDYKVNPKKI